MRDSHHVLPRPPWPRASLSPRANVIASRLCPCHFFGVACTESSFTQAAKGLSVALANTAQSFRVSDTKVGGTIGGGFEWMMAPHWSVKAEALYYGRRRSVSRPMYSLGQTCAKAPATCRYSPQSAAPNGRGLAEVQDECAVTARGSEARS